MGSYTHTNIHICLSFMCMNIFNVKVECFRQGSIYFLASSDNELLLKLPTILPCPCILILMWAKLAYLEGPGVPILTETPACSLWLGNDNNLLYVS